MLGHVCELNVAGSVAKERMLAEERIPFVTFFARAEVSPALVGMLDGGEGDDPSRISVLHTLRSVPIPL